MEFSTAFCEVKPCVLESVLEVCGEKIITRKIAFANAEREVFAELLRIMRIACLQNDIENISNLCYNKRGDFNIKNSNI